MYKCRTAYTLAAAITFVVVIFVVSEHGYRNRIFAPGNTLHVVDAPEKAYQIWNENKVKGRILVLFDNYPHAQGLRNYVGEPQLTPVNLVEFSIFKNIVRKIYYIVPEENWEDFQQQQAIGPIREVDSIDNGLYLFSFSGVPIIAVTPASLPNMSEETLVYVNSRIFDYEQTLELLGKKKINSDIIVSHQGPNR